MKSKSYGFVQDGNVKRIIATEDINIPGFISVQKGETGGIIDGNLNVNDDVYIWINKTSKIKGIFQYPAIYLWMVPN